jgi:hypothetical protein
MFQKGDGQTEPGEVNSLLYIAERTLSKGKRIMWRRNCEERDNLGNGPNMEACWTLVVILKWFVAAG